MILTPLEKECFSLHDSVLSRNIFQKRVISIVIFLLTDHVFQVHFDLPTNILMVMKSAQQCQDILAIYFKNLEIYRYSMLFYTNEKFYGKMEPLFF